ncbi:hypothetical protein C8Q77DRAFT_813444 [Trametes polyzona]|nr:hypothetical protein C8Q77DRAFT_813444 [Trametes polyzona]
MSGCSFGRRRPLTLARTHSIPISSHTTEIYAAYPAYRTDRAHPQPRHARRGTLHMSGCRRSARASDRPPFQPQKQCRLASTIVRGPSGHDCWPRRSPGGGTYISSFVDAVLRNALEGCRTGHVGQGNPRGLPTDKGHDQWWCCRAVTIYATRSRSRYTYVESTRKKNRCSYSLLYDRQKTLNDGELGRRGSPRNRKFRKNRFCRVSHCESISPIPNCTGNFKRRNPSRRSEKPPLPGRSRILPRLNA